MTAWESARISESYRSRHQQCGMWRAAAIECHRHSSSLEQCEEAAYWRSSISSQMDVSKFALDRSAYLNTAAAGALYDTAKSQTNPHSYGVGLLGVGGGGAAATASGLYQYSAAAMAASQAAANGSSGGGGTSGGGGGNSGSGGGGGAAGEYRRPLTVIF
uniref:Uncharacterized protein n=1 Tax=Anopheles melas TaxID=34690 RepID=A0A182UEU0_9DIPT